MTFTGTNCRILLEESGFAKAQPRANYQLEGPAYLSLSYGPVAAVAALATQPTYISMLCHVTLHAYFKSASGISACKILLWGLKADRCGTHTFSRILYHSSHQYSFTLPLVHRYGSSNHLCSGCLQDGTFRGPWDLITLSSEGGNSEVKETMELAPETQMQTHPSMAPTLIGMKRRLARLSSRSASAWIRALSNDPCTGTDGQGFAVA